MRTLVLLAAASLHTSAALLLPSAGHGRSPLHRRARPAVACDFETIEDEDEYETALERYRSWGLLDNGGAGAVGRQPIGAGLVEPRAEAEAALAPLMDAVDGFEGSLAVLDVVDDSVTLAYTGPAHFRAAIELALRDKMPRVERIVFDNCE